MAIEMPVMKQAWKMTVIWLTCSNRLSDALGFIYVLYRSKERILLTAIMDEEIVLVNAMKSRTKKAPIPDVPIIILITSGMIMPVSTIELVTGCGYIGKLDVLCSALADRPITVPRPQGIPKTAKAARLYAGTVARTSLAKDFCQNAVSWRECGVRQKKKKKRG